MSFPGPSLYPSCHPLPALAGDHHLPIRLLITLTWHPLQLSALVSASDAGEAHRIPSIPSSDERYADVGGVPVNSWVLVFFGRHSHFGSDHFANSESHHTTVRVNKTLPIFFPGHFGPSQTTKVRRKGSCDGPQIYGKYERRQWHPDEQRNYDENRCIRLRIHDENFRAVNFP